MSKVRRRKHELLKRIHDVYGKNGIARFKRDLAKIQTKEQSSQSSFHGDGMVRIEGVFDVLDDAYKNVIDVLGVVQDASVKVFDRQTLHKLTKLGSEQWTDMVDEASNIMARIFHESIDIIWIPLKHLCSQFLRVSWSVLIQICDSVPLTNPFVCNIMSLWTFVQSVRDILGQYTPDMFRGATSADFAHLAAQLMKDTSKKAYEWINDTFWEPFKKMIAFIISQFMGGLSVVEPPTTSSSSTKMKSTGSEHSYRRYPLRSFPGDDDDTPSTEPKDVSPIPLTEAFSMHQTMDDLSIGRFGALESSPSFYQGCCKSPPSSEKKTSTTEDSTPSFLFPQVDDDDETGADDDSWESHPLRFFFGLTMELFEKVETDVWIPFLGEICDMIAPVLESWINTIKRTLSQTSHVIYDVVQLLFSFDQLPLSLTDADDDDNGAIPVVIPPLSNSYSHKKRRRPQTLFSGANGLMIDLRTAVYPLVMYVASIGMQITDALSHTAADKISDLIIWAFTNIGDKLGQFFFEQKKLSLVWELVQWEPFVQFCDQHSAVLSDGKVDSPSSQHTSSSVMIDRFHFIRMNLMEEWTEYVQSWMRTTKEHMSIHGGGGGGGTKDEFASSLELAYQFQTAQQWEWFSDVTWAKIQTYSITHKLKSGAWKVFQSIIGRLGSVLTMAGSALYRVGEKVDQMEDWVSSFAPSILNAEKIGTMLLSGISGGIKYGVSFASASSSWMNHSSGGKMMGFLCKLGTWAAKFVWCSGGQLLMNTLFGVVMKFASSAIQWMKEPMDVFAAKCIGLEQTFLKGSTSGHQQQSKSAPPMDVATDDQVDDSGGLSMEQQSSSKSHNSRDRITKGDDSDTEYRFRRFIEANISAHKNHPKEHPKTIPEEIWDLYGKFTEARLHLEQEWMESTQASSSEAASSLSFDRSNTPVFQPPSWRECQFFAHVLHEVVISAEYRHESILFPVEGYEDVFDERRQTERNQLLSPSIMTLRGAEKRLNDELDRFEDEHRGTMSFSLYGSSESLPGGVSSQKWKPIEAQPTKRPSTFNMDLATRRTLVDFMNVSQQSDTVQKILMRKLNPRRSSEKRSYSVTMADITTKMNAITEAIKDVVGHYTVRDPNAIMNSNTPKYKFKVIHNGSDKPPTSLNEYLRKIRADTITCRTELEVCQNEYRLQEVDARGTKEKVQTIRDEFTNLYKTTQVGIGYSQPSDHVKMLMIMDDGEFKRHMTAFNNEFQAILNVQTDNLIADRDAMVAAYKTLKNASKELMEHTSSMVDDLLDEVIDKYSLVDSKYFWIPSLSKWQMLLNYSGNLFTLMNFMANTAVSIHTGTQLAEFVAGVSNKFNEGLKRATDNKILDENTVVHLTGTIQWNYLFFTTYKQIAQQIQFEGLAANTHAQYLRTGQKFKKDSTTSHHPHHAHESRQKREALPWDRFLPHKLALNLKRSRGYKTSNGFICSFSCDEPPPLLGLYTQEILSRMTKDDHIQGTVTSKRTLALERKKTLDHYQRVFSRHFGVNSPLGTYLANQFKLDHRMPLSSFDHNVGLNHRIHVTDDDDERTGASKIIRIAVSETSSGGDFGGVNVQNLISTTRTFVLRHQRRLTDIDSTVDLLPYKFFSVYIQEVLMDAKFTSRMSTLESQCLVFLLGEFCTLNFLQLSAVNARTHVAMDTEVKEESLASGWIFDGPKEENYAHTFRSSSPPLSPKLSALVNMLVHCGLISLQTFYNSLLMGLFRTLSASPSSLLPVLPTNAKSSSSTSKVTNDVGVKESSSSARVHHHKRKNRIERHPDHEQGLRKRKSYHRRNDDHHYIIESQYGRHKKIGQKHSDDLKDQQSKPLDTIYLSPNYISTKQLPSFTEDLGQAVWKHLMYVFPLATMDAPWDSNLWVDEGLRLAGMAFTPMIFQFAPLQKFMSEWWFKGWAFLSAKMWSYVASGKDVNLSDTSNPLTSRYTPENMLSTWGSVTAVGFIFGILAVVLSKGMAMMARKSKSQESKIKQINLMRSIALGYLENLAHESDPVANALPLHHTTKMILFLMRLRNLPNMIINGILQLINEHHKSIFKMVTHIIKYYMPIMAIWVGFFGVKHAKSFYDWSMGGTVISDVTEAIGSFNRGWLFPQEATQSDVMKVLEQRKTARQKISEVETIEWIYPLGGSSVNQKSNSNDRSGYPLMTSGALLPTFRVFNRETQTLKQIIQPPNGEKPLFLKSFIHEGGVPIFVNSVSNKHDAGIFLSDNNRMASGDIMKGYEILAIMDKRFTASMPMPDSSKNPLGFIRQLIIQKGLEKQIVDKNEWLPSTSADLDGQVYNVAIARMWELYKKNNPPATVYDVTSAWEPFVRDLDKLQKSFGAADGDVFSNGMTMLQDTSLFRKKLNKSLEWEKYKEFWNPLKPSQARFIPPSTISPHLQSIGKGPLHAPLDTSSAHNETLQREPLAESSSFTALTEQILTYRQIKAMALNFLKHLLNETPSSQFRVTVCYGPSSFSEEDSTHDSSYTLKYVHPHPTQLQDIYTEQTRTLSLKGLMISCLHELLSEVEPQHSTSSSSNNDRDGDNIPLGPMMAGYLGQEIMTRFPRLWLCVSTGNGDNSSDDTQEGVPITSDEDYDQILLYASWYVMFSRIVDLYSELVAIPDGVPKKVISMINNQGMTDRDRQKEIRHQKRHFKQYSKQIHSLHEQMRKDNGLDESDPLTLHSIATPSPPPPGVYIDDIIPDYLLPPKHQSDTTTTTNSNHEDFEFLNGDHYRATPALDRRDFINALMLCRKHIEKGI